MTRLEKSVPVTARKKVAVVVPTYLRDSFSADEEFAIRHIDAYLSKYDRFLVAPESLRIERPGFVTRYVPDRYFGSTEAHSLMLLNPAFYALFSEYEYILLHHLDAFVLCDRLDEFCALGYDYMGPPWLETPWLPGPPLPKDKRVGNGGFSLRRVASFQRLTSRVREAMQYPRSMDFKDVRGRLLTVLRLPYVNETLWEKFARRLIDDWFVARCATELVPEFRIAPFDVALSFGFEGDPDRCFELNQRRLPFGVHQWNRHKRTFWEPHLLGA